MGRAYNAALDEAQEALGDVRELHNPECRRDWGRRVEEMVEAVNRPVFVPPLGDCTLPPAALYDTNRVYPDNLGRINRDVVDE